MNNNLEDRLIQLAIEEDLGNGDATSLACIPSKHIGKARLLAKEKGILAGLRVAQKVFKKINADLDLVTLKNDGAGIHPGDTILEVSGPSRSLLQAERLVLNFMQRMSGIATTTRTYADALDGLETRVLDTRKTSPGLRYFEKEAVRIGGGGNHRMGLFDMVMIKDNHIDLAGSIEDAINRVQDYFKTTGTRLPVEIEVRSLQDVERVLQRGDVDRIMFDNFSLDETAKGVKLVRGGIETESSGGITLENIRAYGLCGVDYISVGALTHQINSLDLSLKAIK